MKAAVFVFAIVVVCAIAVQASPLLEDTLGAFMRGGYQAPSQAPHPSCCKLSCKYFFHWTSTRLTVSRPVHTDL